MNKNPEEGPSGTETVNDTTTDMFESVSKIIKSFSEQFTSSVKKYSDIMSKFTENLTEEEENTVNNILYGLSYNQRKEIISLVKEGDRDKIRVWWTKITTDPKILDTLVGCSEMLKDIFKIGGNLGCVLGEDVEKIEEFIFSPPIKTPISKKSKLDQILSELSEIKTNQKLLSQKLDDLSVDLELLKN